MTCPDDDLDDTSVNGVIADHDDCCDDDSGPPWDPDGDYPEETDIGDDGDEDE